VVIAAIPANEASVSQTGVAIALDPAASEFCSCQDTGYRVNDAQLSTAEMIERYVAMIDQYPIWSIEDGLAEQDTSGWRDLTVRIGDRAQIVGDDNFCTNPGIISQAIKDGIANAALTKLNQIGILTETLEAMAVCHRAGYAQMVSHSSGRHRMTSSPTSPSEPAAVKSSQGPPPERSGSPSTTGSWTSPPNTRS